MTIVSLRLPTGEGSGFVPRKLDWAIRAARPRDRTWAVAAAARWTIRARLENMDSG